MYLAKLVEKYKSDGKYISIDKQESEFDQQQDSSEYWLKASGQ
jgi:hypothetical protein